MKKLLAILLAAVLVLSMGAVAFAEDDTVSVKSISNSEELIAAINSQADNQKWVLAAGTYDVGSSCMEHESSINGVEKGFVFPIHANNITIIGEGDVTITSSYSVPESGGGNWVNQNFITVSGNNVTIENVKLKGNYNGYYEGCNKVIEVLGSTFTLKNVECLPLEDSEGKQNSGSIYISSDSAGETAIENVTLYSWINARAVTSGTVTAKNVTQDFTNNVYAGYYSETYGYAWNPGISGDSVDVQSLTIKVDNNSEFIKQIVENLKPNTTIVLESDIEVSEEVYIKTANVTIEGNGHTITAAEDFHENTSGQNQLFKIEADNVTLNDVKLVGTEETKHTLDVYCADNVVLNNVTLDHSEAASGAPLVNNASNVTVKGSFEVVTGEKSWYGINVDNKNGEASLVFDEGATITFENKADSDRNLIQIDETNADAKITLESKSDDIAFAESGDNIFNLHTHNYVNGKCTACGAEDPNYVKPTTPTRPSYNDTTTIVIGGNKSDDDKVTVEANPNTGAPVTVPVFAVLAVAGAVVAAIK